MKKLLIVCAAAFFALSLSAQGLPDFANIENHNIRHKSTSAKTSFDVLEYLGWGFHNVMGDASFTDHTGFGQNREFFLNLFQFSIKPNKYNAITLGVDLNWDNYRLDSNWSWAPFDLPVGSASAEQLKMVIMGLMGYSRNGSVLPAPFPGSVDKSVLRVLSFDVPLDFTRKMGQMGFTIGAAAEFNLPGWTKFKGSGDSTVTGVSGYSVEPMTGKGIKTNLVTYNFHVKIAYNGFGIFAKYNPKPVLQEGLGPQFTTWTVGFFL